MNASAQDIYHDPEFDNVSLYTLHARKLIDIYSTNDDCVCLRQFNSKLEPTIIKLHINDVKQVIKGIRIALEEVNNAHQYRGQFESEFPKNVYIQKLTDELDNEKVRLGFSRA